MPKQVSLEGLKDYIQITEKDSGMEVYHNFSDGFPISFQS